MVQFGINPRVMFVLFPFSGDMEHGMRNRIILKDVLKKSISSRGTVKGSPPLAYEWHSGPRKLWDLVNKLLGSISNASKSSSKTRCSLNKLPVFP